MENKNQIQKILSKNSKDYDIGLTNYNFAKFFEVLPLENGPIFNLHKNLVIKNVEYIPSSFYTPYQIIDGDQWTLISYKHYGTIELWWVICKFNLIDDPLFLPPIGTTIKIPTKDIVDQIIQQIRDN